MNGKRKKRRKKKGSAYMGYMDVRRFKHNL